jgi:hypothetical protein
VTFEELQAEVVRLGKRVEQLERGTKGDDAKKLAKRVAELELRAMQARKRK